MENVFVPDAAVGGRRKPGVWHPLMEIVTLVAFPLVYAVYTGVAEAARDLAVKAAARQPDVSMVDAVGALDTELAAGGSALRRVGPFSRGAPPGPGTSNTIFIHRALIRGPALATAASGAHVRGGRR